MSKSPTIHPSADSDQPSAHVQLSRAYDFDFLGQCKAALCHAANDLFIRSIAFDGLPGLTRLFIAWHLVQIDAHDSRTGETALTTAVAAGKIEVSKRLALSLNFFKMRDNDGTKFCHA